MRIRAVLVGLMKGILGQRELGVFIGIDKAIVRILVVV